MKQSYSINSLLRSIKVIEQVVDSRERLSFTEIAGKNKIPKTTLFRILSTLTTEQWIEKSGDGYLPGYRLLQMGFRALSRMKIREIAVPHLDWLSRKVEETAHLVTLFGKKCLITEVCDGPKHIRISCRPGTMTALYCSAPGKVFLAFRVGEANLSAFMKGETLQRRTHRTITRMRDLRAEIRRVVEQGYAVDDAEYFEDVRCIAAPIRDAFGQTIAAVGITAPAASLKKNMVKTTASLVVEAGNMIAKALGAE